MPARSKSQSRYIRAMRNKYGSKKNAPKNMKWVFDKDWTSDVKVSELPEKVMEFNEFIKENNQINENFFNTLPNSIKELHKMFSDKGFKLYVVGGSVRDYKKGDKPKDFDLCTDATPEEVLNIIGKKWKTTTQGESFMVVVVYTEDQPDGMEIATFRSDLYDEESLGTTRNPKVVKSDIKGDVNRRDITYNALFYDLDKKEIVDLVGGLDDLQNKVSRFIGNPNLRIKEDPIRILRMIRFTVRYGFTIDQSAKDAILENKHLLNIITKERLWNDSIGEIPKAFKQLKGNFKEYLEYFNEFNLWEQVIGTDDINREIKESSSLSLYISNLLKNNKSIHSLSKYLVETWKISSEIADKSEFLIKLLSLKEDNVMDLYKSKVRCHIKDDMIIEWLEINDLQNNKLFKSFLLYKPSVSSEELMSKGFKGKTLGDEIKRLEILKFRDFINRS